MPDTAHHLYGPSSLERRALCPASARLEKGLPNTESPYAAEGTMLHSVVAFWINIRSTGVLPPGVEKLTWEQRDACLRCYRFAVDLIPPKADVYIEQKLVLKNWTAELLDGTPDIVIDDGEALIIIDWKFGRNPVTPASENLQGAGYAAMGMQTYKRKQAVVYFYQPRVLKENEKPEGFLFTDCPAIVTNIRDIIGKCEDPAAPVCPGAKQCKYCRAKEQMVCPALSPMIPALAEKAAVPRSKGLDAMAPEQLVTLWKQWKLVETLGKRIDYRIKAIIHKYGRCGSLVLKSKQGNRKCEDPAALFALLDREELVTPVEFVDACSVSVYNLELLIADKLKTAGKTKTQKEGKERFAVLTGHLITREAESESIVELER